MNKSDLKNFTSWLGKRSYAARVERLGIVHHPRRCPREREEGRQTAKKGIRS